MLFGEKAVVGHLNAFSQNDLMEYVESLIRQSRIHEKSGGTNYSWLKSRPVPDCSNELEEFKPMVQKLSSENCAAIAVKLDNITEGNVSTAVILTSFKKLLEEQESMSLIETNIKRTKETKHKKGNKVHPELSGRQATVSFILD